MSRTRASYSTCTACGNRLAAAAATLYLIRRPGWREPAFGGYLCPECVETLNAYALGVRRIYDLEEFDRHGQRRLPWTNPVRYGRPGGGVGSDSTTREPKATPLLTPQLSRP